MTTRRTSVSITELETIFYRELKLRLIIRADITTKLKRFFIDDVYKILSTEEARVFVNGLVTNTPFTISTGFGNYHINEKGVKYGTAHRKENTG